MMMKKYFFYYQDCVYRRRQTKFPNLNRTFSQLNQDASFLKLHSAQQSKKNPIIFIDMTGKICATKH